MKPRIFLTTALIALILIYIPVLASINTVSHTDNQSNSEIRSKSKTNPSADHPLPVNNPMATHRNNLSHKGEGHHGEEDGKHHHFHMDRVKRIRRFYNIFCFITKCFLTITHICIMICVFKAVFAH